MRGGEATLRIIDNISRNEHDDMQAMAVIKLLNAAWVLCYISFSLFFFL